MLKSGFVMISIANVLDAKVASYHQLCRVGVECYLKLPKLSGTLILSSLFRSRMMAWRVSMDGEVTRMVSPWMLGLVFWYSSRIFLEIFFAVSWSRVVTSFYFLAGAHSSDGFEFLAVEDFW